MDGHLENPQAGSVASGVALVSGWHCTARKIELVIDGRPAMVAAHGTSRGDTAPICGRSDTGFGYLINWNGYTPGPHTIRVLANGVEFARADFRVEHFGSEFMTGKSGGATVDDFPAPGTAVDLAWRESLQGFAIERIYASPSPLGGRWNGANLERRSGCSQPQNEGTRGTYAQYDISLTSESLNVQQAGITGLNCAYTGTLATPGALRTATGSYSCTDGKRGTWSVTDYLARPTEMQLRMEIKLNTTETCSIDAILGGSRF